uniref:GT23 domain-containing protein n=1 Tax=Guillardia theta TaxID=55529 RepID=A0A7S4PLD7_GUITH
MDEDNMTTTTTTILNVVSWTDFVQSHIRDHLSLLTREARSAEESVLSVHIRRGDKFTESPTVSDEVYKNIIRGLAEKKKVQHMIVESDDPVVFAKAVEWSKEFKINLLRFDTSNTTFHSGTNSKLSLQTHQINITEYATSAISLVARLALGNIFLGSFSSNVFRLAYEIAFSEENIKFSPCSLDVLWYASP